jgi:glycosyltransferase involved in cell wall biosynthesis
VILSKFKNDPRVEILSKPNGGCASARNYGRLHSRASHIAFVDADDIPGKNLFSGLLDLARHTGAEIVQGGFDMLFDDGNGGLRTEPSYESTDDIVVNSHRHNLGFATCHLLPSTYLMEGQPTIWRRVYRQDFLNNRKIWFPEHIRAFDDQIFQMLTLQSVRNVPMLDGVSYGYRQHAGQDIRQGDERNFYSLEMFRLMLKRGINEGWSDFFPLLKSFVNTVNWIYGRLRPDLREPFLKGAAELWVYARKTLGVNEFDGLPDSVFQAVDFSFYTKKLEADLSAFGVSYGWIYLDSLEMQVPMVKSLRG